jgi:hypothetical protein
MTTLICAKTLYSCGLACIESILKDNGLDFEQETMLSEYSDHFPKWAEHLGILSITDYKKIFELVGLPVDVVLPDKFRDSIELMQKDDLVGAILTTRKFWKDSTKTEMMDLFHALRLISADSRGVTVMNPAQCPTPAQIWSFPWEDVAKFETQPAMFFPKKA